jgi:hypothetical protein
MNNTNSRFWVDFASEGGCVSEFDGAQVERTVSTKTLVSTVVLLVGANLWLDIVILLMNFDHAAGLS